MQCRRPQRPTALESAGLGPLERACAQLVSQVLAPALFPERFYRKVGLKPHPASALAHDKNVYQYKYLEVHMNPSLFYSMHRTESELFIFSYVYDYSIHVIFRPLG
jgi:hypothetical protein